MNKKTQIVLPPFTKENPLIVPQSLYDLIVKLYWEQENIVPSPLLQTNEKDSHNKNEIPFGRYRNH
jgi:hypothetical protein